MNKLLLNFFVLCFVHTIDCLWKRRKEGWDSGLHMGVQTERVVCCSNLLIWRYFCGQKEAVREGAVVVRHLHQLSLAVAGWLMNVHSLFRPLLFAL